MTRVLVTITIMVCFVLLVILVLNMEDKSKVIKNSFVLFIISFLLCEFFINEIVMDYFISMLIRFYYFPTFSSIIMTVLIAIGLFLYNICNSKLPDKYRIINYIFAFMIIIGYIIFMILDVDINLYDELYIGSSLKCIRYISRTFIVWMVVILTIKYYHYFFKRR